MKVFFFFVSWVFVVWVPRCYLFVHLHCIRDFQLRVCLHGGGGPQVGEVTRPFSPIRYSFITVQIVLKVQGYDLRNAFDGFFSSSSSFGRAKVAFA